MSIIFEKLSGDTKVIANPTLDGTEPNLTGLEVNGAKYSIPSGSSNPLYKHSVEIKGYESTNAYGYAKIEIINHSSEPFTIDSLKTLVTEKGTLFTTNQYEYHTGVTGWAVNGVYSGVVTYILLYYGNTFFLYYGSAYNSLSMIKLNNGLSLKDYVELVE